MNRWMPTLITTRPAKRAALTALLAALMLLLPGKAALAQDAPFTGVVTQNSVDIRSGAGLAFYVVGELGRNDVVRVEEVLFNNTWYKIQVPQGIYSYVSKAFIDAQGDGSAGVINSNDTEVRAASLRGPGVSYRVQTTLSRGTRVRIIDEEGTYYKIAPPADAFVFIPAGTLREATAADMVPAPPAEGEGEGETEEPVAPVPPVPPVQEPEVEEPEVEQPEVEVPAQAEGEGEAEAPMPQPPVEEPDVQAPAEGEGEAEIETPMPEGEGEAEGEGESETEGEGEASEGEGEGQAPGQLPPAPDVEVQTPARSDELKALEMQLLPYFTLPLEDRPLAEMTRRYRAILTEADLGQVDQKIVEVRLRTLNGWQRNLTAILASRAAREASRERTEVPTEEEVASRPVEYTEVGILRISTQFNGQQQGLPQMYALVNPAGRTIAYVRPGGAVQVAPLLDQLVGIVGTRRYDPALKIHIINVERADALTCNESAEDEDTAAE